MNKFIVVVDSGFVFVGNVDSFESHMVTIHNARNIRVYGTENGLGQLALTGKTSSTVLDDVGTMHVNQNKIIFCIEVDPNVDL